MKTTILTLSVIFSLHLSAQVPLKTVIQKGHSEVVKEAAYTPSGKYVATASRDRSVKIWNVENGREIKTLLGHSHTVNALDFTSDSRRLASSSADNTVKVWEVETGKVLWTSPASNEFMTEVAISPDDRFLAYGGYDWHFTILDLNTYDTIRTIKVNTVKNMDGIDLEFSPDGQWLAVGEDNRTLKLYNTTSWELIYTFQPGKGYCGGCISLVSFHPNGKEFIKASNKGAIELYDLSSGTLKEKYREAIDDLRSVEFNNEGDKLVVATEDSLFVYQEGKLFSSFLPEVKEINHATFSPGGDQVLISGNDNRASLWSFKGKRLKDFSGILQQRDRGGITYDPDNYWESYIARYITYKNNLLLTRDGDFLIKGKIGKKVRMWDIKTGDLKMEFIGHEKAVLALALTEKEDRLVTGGGDGKVMLWEVSSGKLMHTFSGHREPVFDVAISHDQSKIASCSWDGKVNVWDIPTGSLISSIYMENASGFTLEFSPNDVYLLLGKLDKTLQLWEYESKQLVRDFLGHTEIITKVRWSEDPNAFVSTGLEGNVIMWDVPSGLICNKFKHSEAVFDAVFYENDRLITAGADRVIRITDLRTGSTVQELKGHQAQITSLNLDREKGILVSIDRDDVIKFWKLTEGQEFFEHILIGENDWMIRTSDGHFYATDGAMQNIHFVRGMETYLIDQFFDEFYNPNLLPEIFENKDKSRYNSLQGALEKSPPPSLKFGSLPEKKGNEVTLYLKITEQGGGVENLQFYHNGKRLPDENLRLEDVRAEKDEKVVKFTTSLVAGVNEFMAKAYSIGNISSEPATTEVISDSDIPGSTCHVLTIGINTYRNPQLNLNYARNDAESFVRMIEEAGSAIYSDVKIYQLYDDEASRENILNKLDELAGRVQLNDVFILYYAGHGSAVDEQFYFIPTESTRLYEGNALEKQAINAELLQEKLKNIRALKQVIIMDACQSGQSVELLAQRGALEEKAISQLSRSTGIHVIAAAGSEQFATEFVELGHGLFTYLLLKALSGEADGAPKDGKITIYEIKSYLDDQVPEMSLQYKGKPQYPYSFSRGRDFPIGLKKKNK